MCGALSARGDSACAVVALKREQPPPGALYRTLYQPWLACAVTLQTCDRDGDDAVTSILVRRRRATETRPAVAIVVGTTNDTIAAVVPAASASPVAAAPAATEPAEVRIISAANRSVEET